jgi:hypothetical protein
VKTRQGPCRETLKGQSPGEHPAVGALITRRAPGTSGRVKAQEPRPSGPAISLSGETVYRMAKRYVGSSGRKRAGNLSGGEGSEGRIP